MVMQKVSTWHGSYRLEERTGVALVERNGMKQNGGFQEVRFAPIVTD
jgi:hypothetical protein